MNNIYNNLFYTFGVDLSHKDTSEEFIFAKKYKFLKSNKQIGINGQNYCIPIKNDNGRLISINQIKTYIENFIEYANENPEISFQVTEIACSENEYNSFQIAPLFKNAPLNCLLPAHWNTYTNRNNKVALFFEDDFNDISFLNQMINHFSKNLSVFNFIFNDSNELVNQHMKDTNSDIVTVTKHYGESEDFSKIINAKEILVHANYVLILKTKESEYIKSLTELCEKNDINYRLVDYNKKT
jgi:hypothetical protein